MNSRSLAVNDYARMALGIIRLINGIPALLAPGWLLQRLGTDAEHNPAAVYVFRMFGIRTILIGAALLAPPSVVRAHAVRSAVVIHASDTTAAALAGIGGQLPRRASLMATAISATNTVLAILARRE